jgi:hypothetical protein
MATQTAPGAEPLPVAAPREMSRCECSGVPFSTVARHLAEGLTCEEACRRTGCGQICTACLPDLRAYLERRIAF